ncbi:MAG: hypothetical protein IJU54_02960 [Alphaproteobacteria bacterium]|nr:hypothetical protein [Alphaproteobacteria bacterium]
MLEIFSPRDYLNGINDVITCNKDGSRINLQDLLNYLSSKLYMISINIIKEMQSVLIRQINNQNITDNEYNQMRGHLNQQLSNIFDETTKIKDCFNI